MPRGRGATRPDRGSDARDGAYPENRNELAVGLPHGTDVGLRYGKVKRRLVAEGSRHIAGDLDCESARKVDPMASPRKPLI